LHGFFVFPFAIKTLSKFFEELKVISYYEDRFLVVIDRPVHIFCVVHRHEDITLKLLNFGGFKLSILLYNFIQLKLSFLRFVVLKI
jgi:hypothetical protein